jgi:hypothetical protein
MGKSAIDFGSHRWEEMSTNVEEKSHGIANVIFGKTRSLLIARLVNDRALSSASPTPDPYPLVIMITRVGQWGHCLQQRDNSQRTPMSLARPLFRAGLHEGSGGSGKGPPGVPADDPGFESEISA